MKRLLLACLLAGTAIASLAQSTGPVVILNNTDPVQAASAWANGVLPMSPSQYRQRRAEAAGAVTVPAAAVTNPYDPRFYAQWSADRAVYDAQRTLEQQEALRSQEKRQLGLPVMPWAMPRRTAR